MRMSPIQAQETNGLKGFGFTITWEEREEERLELARSLQAKGLGVEDIAVELFGIADVSTCARVRDLLREEGR